MRYETYRYSKDGGVFRTAGKRDFTVPPCMEGKGGFSYPMCVKNRGAGQVVWSDRVEYNLGDYVPPCLDGQKCPFGLFG